MAELKAGGLALVYGLVKNADENGKFVTLVSLRDVIDSEEKAWEVTGNLISREGEVGVGYFWPKNLMPINGDESPDALRYAKEISNA